MDGKIALVTGGTSGIGKAIALGLAAQGLHVVLLARNPERAKAVSSEARLRNAAAIVDWIEADLASLASVRQAAGAFSEKSPRLDVFVGAAGVFHKSRRETVDGVEATFAVNYLSHFLLANLLEPALRRAAPSRVILVAARYGGTRIDFDDLMVKRRKFSVMNSVPATKLAEVLLAQELARRWASTGISVNAVHPGLVAHTHLLDEVGGLWRWITNTFGGTPEKGADTALWLATAPEAAGITGKLLAKRRELPTPGQGSDDGARERLWTESGRMSGIDFGGSPPPPVP